MLCPGQHAEPTALAEATASKPAFRHLESASCNLPWGFFAHRLINRMSVFTLPPAMIGFFKTHIQYISTHAVDPDKRRFTDSREAPRHFLDTEFYDSRGFDSIPRSYASAEAYYGSDSLHKHGILPWYIEHTYNKLKQAFEKENSSLILHYAAELGHYVADACVPLHTTRNYNGQMTHQEGIHALWESRIPELLSDQYDFFAGRATYLPHIQPLIWNALHISYLEKDSVLMLEARLNMEFPGDRKYSFNTRGKMVLKNYSEAYVRQYSELLNRMVERRMLDAIRFLGSLWYTAWIDAGEPDLQKMSETILPDSLSRLQQPADTSPQIASPPEGGN